MSDTCDVCKLPVEASSKGACLIGCSNDRWCRQHPSCKIQFQEAQEQPNDKDLLDPDPSVHDVGDTSISFEIISDSTKRRRELLVDSLGYRYGIQRRTKTTVHWQCTVRPKKNPCGAKIVQSKSGSVRPGLQAHNHPADPGSSLVAKITKRVKDTAISDVLKPASAIVNQVYLEEIGDAPLPALPKPDLMARTVNRIRHNLHPRSTPNDLK